MVGQLDLEPVGTLADDFELGTVLDEIDHARGDGRTAADIRGIHRDDMVVLPRDSAAAAVFSAAQVQQLTDELLRRKDAAEAASLDDERQVGHTEQDRLISLPPTWLPKG